MTRYFAATEIGGETIRLGLESTDRIRPIVAIGDRVGWSTLLVNLALQDAAVGEGFLFINLGSVLPRAGQILLARKGSSCQDLASRFVPGTSCIVDVASELSGSEAGDLLVGLFTELEKRNLFTSDRVIHVYIAGLERAAHPALIEIIERLSGRGASFSVGLESSRGVPVGFPQALVSLASGIIVFRTDAYDALWVERYLKLPSFSGNLTRLPALSCFVQLQRPLPGEGYPAKVLLSMDIPFPVAPTPSPLPTLFNPDSIREMLAITEEEDELY